MWKTTIRHLSKVTSTHDLAVKNTSFAQRTLLQVAKWMGYDRPSSVAIRLSRLLYASCTRESRRKEVYIGACGLQDNFNTWFSVTQLYIWMLMVRLRSEPHGKMISQELVNRFFEDAEDKVTALGVRNGRVLRAIMLERISIFHGGVLAYDEGMCKSDAVLAGALWRNLYTDARYDTNLVWMIKHVRRELARLDKCPSEQLLRGQVAFESAKVT
jgi:cytochrome b pre-mRNA-processing protein 3